LAEQSRNAVRIEARKYLDFKVRKLYSANPHTRAQWDKVHLTPELADAAIKSLHAMSDRRLLKVGVDIARACTVGSRESLELCALQQLAPRAAEMRRLREELLPPALRAQDEKLQAMRRKFVHHGFFKLSDDFGGWHAEVALAKHRRLQAGELGQNLLNWYSYGAPILSVALDGLFAIIMAVLPGESGMLTNRPVDYALWAVEGADTIVECLINVKRGVIYYASCGMDVIFWLVDIVWVFFDGQPGVTAPHRITTCRSYTVWKNLTGTCGNCLGTSTSRLGGVNGIDTCNNYCSSFGHGCKFAAAAVEGSCYARGEYGCDEKIPLGTRMLCQCFTGRRLVGKESQDVGTVPASRALQVLASENSTTTTTTATSTTSSTLTTSTQENRTTTTSTTTATTTTSTTGVRLVTPRPGIESITCGSYTVWPQIQGAACGYCRALVPSRCDTYCQAFNHTCYAAAVPDGETCMESAPATCHREPGPGRNMLCTCGLANGQQAPPSRCVDYRLWLTIDSHVCGDCTAIGRLNVPMQPFANCQQFCQSFGHVCQRAAVGSSKGRAPCTVLQQLGCTNSSSGLQEALCTCVRP